MSSECAELHSQVALLERHTFPFDERAIPKNGIYVLFEVGEHGHGGDRIIRVGTHTGNNQLRPRLRQHFLKENKNRSIFRKNIGRALLAKRSDPFLEQWELDLTSRKDKETHGHLVDRDYQLEVEREVSAYIRQAFSFCAFRVDNEAERLELESKLISTVSLCNECGPSSTWLGRHSPKEKIRRSGLWLVNELYKTPLDEHGLNLLAQALANSQALVER